MTDIIDSFVVALGLDPTNYNREIKNYRDDRKRLGEEEKRANQTTEDSQKRLTAGFRTLRNEAAGFLLVLAGANSVKQFVGNILTGDAAVGRLAKNLGVATESLSAWQGAVKRAGGSSGDADSAFRTLSGAFQSLQLTGTTGNDADFQGLGVGAKDLQNPEDALLKISDASSRMGRPEFNARLGRLGFNEPTIALLAKGRVEVTRLLEEQRRLGVTTDKNAESAAKFDEQLNVLESAIKGKVRPVLESVVGTLVEWLEKGDNVNTMMIAAEGIIGAFGIAAFAAAPQLFLLAGAISAIAYAFEAFNKAKPGDGSIMGTVKDGYYNIRSQYYRKMADNAWSNADSASNPADRAAWETRAKSYENSFSQNRENWRTAREGGGQSEQGTTATGGGGAASGGGSIEAFFKARGYTAAQARGIAAGIHAESGGNASAFNSAGGGQGAYGIGQWRGARLAGLRRRYGNRPTMQQQLEYLDWELKGGDAGGAGVRSATTAQGALSAYIGGPGWGFMRPDAAGRLGDLSRGNRWLNGGGPAMASRGGGGPAGGAVNQTTTVGQVIVYSAATDAEGVARDMRGALAKRGLVAQANTGLTG